MSNVILYANGTSENHGCEAIAVTTAELLKDEVDIIYCTTTNLKYELEENNAIMKNEKCQMIEYYYYRKKSFINLCISKLERMLFHSNYFYISKPWIKNVDKVFGQCKIALSVGGDNYCNNDLEWLYQSHRQAKNKGLITVLWGCSVEDNCLTDKRMKEDLAAYDLICARESISYHTLLKINKNVKLYPDPAFLLKQECLQLPVGFQEGNTVGINVSPTIMNFEVKKGTVFANYKYLIEYIIRHTKYQIALIPHVVFGKIHCDYEVLRQLFVEFENTGRVVLIKDCNCCQLKGYISRCKMVVAARTHASIAAYSTCVPTVVVGYSVKARGIAEDIFGTYENYVVPVQSLMKKTDLTEKFQWLDENCDNIRRYLDNNMGNYIESARGAKSEICKLLEG